jgi:hypothetical protein
VGRWQEVGLFRYATEAAFDWLGTKDSFYWPTAELRYQGTSQVLLHSTCSVV